MSYNRFVTKKRHGTLNEIMRQEPESKNNSNSLDLLQTTLKPTNHSEFLSLEEGMTVEVCVVVFVLSYQCKGEKKAFIDIS